MNMPPPFGIFLVIFGVVASFIAFVILTSIVRGIAQWSSNNAAPRETFAARVVTKRLHVSGGSGDSSASTAYYMTFERLTDQARQEFEVDSTAYGSFAEEDHGELTHQGTRFQGFVRSMSPIVPPSPPTPADRPLRYCGYCGHQLAAETNKCPGCGSLWHPRTASET
jgi:hypothetical protein